MGVSMSPFDDDYYYQRRVVYPNRILYVAPPGTVLVPQGSIPPGMPINPHPRIIYTNSPNMPNIRVGMRPMPMPLNMPMQPMYPQQQKKTIPNLAQYFEEVELTQSILDKGEQKKCSICLEDFEVGAKIIYLPCFHYYHAKCIETWVQNSDKCPLCNIEIKIPQ
jgi:hypothetical protein